ncbi:MAG: PAS domain-containing sensor histidine kinase, partial [Gammaproteobacteria bacterium]
EKKGKVRRFENEFRTKEGKTLIGSMSVSLIEMEGEKCMVSMTRDITERKQAEAQVLKSREHLRNLATRLQMIREDERTLIARKIHDELGQTLTGLKMDMFWLADRLPKHWKKIPQRTRVMLSLLDSTIDFVRKFSMELRPSILDDLGLAAAIEWQVNEFATRTDCIHTLDIDIPDLRPDHNRDTAIFRILQEALTNVAQHANADQVKVSLARSDSQLVLTVKDNGTGIDEEKITSSSSLGLIGMRERTGALGGKIMIEKAEEGGTRLTLTVPYGGGVT